MEKVKIETKPNKYIEISKSYYWIILIFTGLLMGVLSMKLLGNSLRMGILMGIVYSTIFILTDYFIWEDEK